MAGFGRQSASLSGALGAVGAACIWLVPAFLAVEVAGCRNAVESRDARSAAQAGDPTASPAAEPPRGEPVEVPGSLASARTVYQSRGVIALDVKSSALQLGDEFSLVNETTGAALIEQERSKLGLSPAITGWNLDGYDVTLRIYLLNPEFSRSFVPGANSLRLSVASTADITGKTATTLVTLRDFTLFGESSGVFESGQQRAGGYEGSFVPFTNSVLTSKGKGLLVTGFGNIINR